MAALNRRVQPQHASGAHVRCNHKISHLCHAPHHFHERHLAFLGRRVKAFFVAPDRIAKAERSLQKRPNRFSAFAKRMHSRSRYLHSPLEANFKRVERLATRPRFHHRAQRALSSFTSFPAALLLVTTRFRARAGTRFQPRVGICPCGSARLILMGHQRRTLQRGWLD